MNKESVFLESANVLINSSKLTEIKRKNKNVCVSEIELNKKEAKELGKNKGLYLTITFDKLVGNVEVLIDELLESLKKAFKYLNIKKNDKILLVGLGNKNISSDSLGYLVTEKMDIDNNLCKIYKDVFSSTNIDSVSYIKNLSKFLNAKLVIVIDSLMARDISRLNKTIQISTGGIKPGSAVSNNFDEISFNVLKIPVIAIGVPTIMNISDITNISKDLIVTEKNIDIEVENIASIISIVINRML